MNQLLPIVVSMSIFLISSAMPAADINLTQPENARTGALDYQKQFRLTVEKWVKNASNEFSPEVYPIEKTITLSFDHSTITEEFDGFILEITSYRGLKDRSLTIEQNLKKPGHPFNDPTVGIARNHSTINDPQGNQFSYENYYVNVDENTKYRIRLWDLIKNP